MNWDELSGLLDEIVAWAGGPALVPGDGRLPAGCRVAFRGGCLDPHADGLRRTAAA